MRGKQLAGRWLNTQEMAAELDMHRTTLMRMKQTGYFVETRHWRRKNPMNSKSDLLWNVDKIFIKMDIQL